MKLATSAHFKLKYLLACCYAKFKFTRPYPPEKKLYICGTVGSLYLWNIYPIVNRMINDDIQGNTYHYIHICTFLAAVFFYSSGWPQKSYPGFCDHFFHGHQIFHVLIAITTYYQVLSLRYDMNNYFLKSSENPNRLHCSVCAIKLKTNN